VKSIYINSVGSVSAQKTFDNSDFLEDVVYYDENVIKVINPNYKDYIPPAAARRMAKGIKMSTVSSKTALGEAGLKNVDAIMVGTGLGCIGDSAKFVGDIIDNDEQFLTPTRFIQSSHNTVSGQIALAIGCKGYNFTYVNASVSFESCLIDALLQLRTNEAKNILVGGVDEIADHHVRSHQLIQHIKQQPVKAQQLLQSGTKGCVSAEGSNFFVLSNEKQASTYAELVAVKTFNTLTKERLEPVVKQFLSENRLTTTAIDTVILGNNGDVDFDGYYNILSAGMFHTTSQLYYKHLSGEFDTAASFGFWLGSKILKSQSIPKAVRLNAIKTDSIKTILLYNQYRGENHTLTLLRQC